MPTACALWRSPLFQQEAATSPFYVVALAPALTLSRGPALFCFTTKDHTPTGVWSFFILPGVFVHTRSFGIWGAGCSTKALFIRGFSSRDAGACSFFCASGLRRRSLPPARPEHDSRGTGENRILQRLQRQKGLH